MPNVFQFLGLPANHRPKSKVVQLVKHYKEVPDSRKKFPLIAQVKKDGVFGMIVVRHDGAVGCFGRTGEQLSSTKALLDFAWVNSLKPGVYIGEILSEQPCSLEELSGVLNPNRVNILDSYQGLIASMLCIHLHDYLTVPEFISGHSDLGYAQRYNRMCDNLTPAGCFSILPTSIIYDEQSRIAFTDACVAASEEGAVYKQPAADWVAGHKGYRVMKEVRVVTYDLLCTRVEEGEGKYTGLVANMYFRWRDGTEIKAMPGKGHTHESCRNMWISATGLVFMHKHNPVGKIWKVKGLQDSSKGKIRLPKVEEERHDKVTADY